MANVTNVLEKLWKRFYHVALILGKSPSSYYMTMEYYHIFDLLDELKSEEQKAIEAIRKSLRRTRPMIVSSDQLEDYIQRIEFANEILLNLEYLVKKTFETYMTFINSHWIINGKMDALEQQRVLSEKYDMSMTEWQFLLSKIERFNDIAKSCS